MKSRFWNTWSKEEPKVRSPIVFKDREDNSRGSGETRRKTRNGTRLTDRFSPIRHGKSRTSSSNGHDEQDNDEDGTSPVLFIRGGDSGSSWEREKSPRRYNEESRRRKSKGAGTSDNHDRSVDARLTNGKSRTAMGNGFVKQVKRSDESLGSLERDRRGVNFKGTFEDEKKCNLYDEEINGNCEPIKFLRKLEEFDYRHNVNDAKAVHRKFHKHNTVKEIRNGDSIPRRSSSARQEFIYVDKRSRNQDDDDDYCSPDRDIEPLREPNGRHLTNGNRRKSRSDNHHPQKYKPSNLEDFDMRYEKSHRDPRRDSDLVITSRENSFSEHDIISRRRSSSEYRKKDHHDDKPSSKSRDSSLKRESSRDRQIFRKISFSLKSKDKKKQSKDNTSESDAIRMNSRKDDRHSRPLTPPTSEDLEADEIPRRRKIFSSKDHRDDCIRHQIYRDSRDLSWIDKELSWYSSEESPEREKSRRISSDRDDSDPGFSTIERNGTTVIRIRTTSESPVGPGERRFQRRSSRDVSIEQHRSRYDENDGNMDLEDIDEFFDRTQQRKDSSQSQNHHDSVCMKKN